MLPPGSFAIKILELRKAARLSQKQVADHVGITRQAISQFEKGESKPSPETVEKMASLFNEPDLLALLAHSSKAPNDVHASALLSEIPVLALRHVSFKARASFVELGGATTDSGLFDKVLHRLPPGKTEADYADAIVFDIEGDSMEPSLKSGQQVIAWPVPESRWEYIHNATCVVAYDDTVTVKRITDNDLFSNNRLVLRATGGSGGSFAVAREHILSIWEVKEFYGTMPYTYYM